MMGVVVVQEGEEGPGRSVRPELVQPGQKVAVDPRGALAVPGCRPAPDSLGTDGGASAGCLSTKFTVRCTSANRAARRGA